ncbi:hypothetical protein [Paraburkholderia sacchari]|uniref:hypothetical protein n=1 Tax=Paraburkholderia sacchari TaxID=159450 RepID=UPI0005432E9F|nr:hypothetical protein [Paraburkholderia sacchari]NLP60296.1 hypothetical protein [Paraburkholderia sacchari]
MCSSPRPGRLRDIHADPARARAQAHFTWRRIGQQLEALYARLAGAPAAQGDQERMVANARAASLRAFV